MKNNTGLVYDVRNITTFRELIEAPPSFTAKGRHSSSPTAVR